MAGTGSSIKTAIELVGGDAVIQESKRVAAALEQTASVVSDIGKTTIPTNGGLQQIFLTIKGGTQSVNEHGQAVHGLANAYHILHPILGVAGASMGEFRAFAVASRLGILGLAAAVGGAALVELGRLSDAAATIKQRLLDIAGTKVGEDLASNFKRGEEATNSAAGAMSAAAEAITRAVNASKEGSGNWQVTGARIANLAVVTKTWSEAIQLGKVNADDAAKAVNTIAQAIFKLQTETKPGQKQTIIDFSSGVAEFKEVETEAEKVTTAVGLTFETFNQLGELSPGLQRKLSEAFGFKDIDAFRAKLSTTPATIEEVIAATAKMAPETDQLFKDMNSKIQGLSSEWTKFKNLLFNIAEGISPESNPITVFLAVMTGLLQAATSDAGKTKEGVLAVGQAMVELDNRPAPANWGAAFGRMLDDRLKQLDRIKTTMQDLGSGGVNPITGTAGIGGGATGGLFRGKPGRDTNLFWLTDYEYIMNPAAVKKYGVDFMHMINSLQWPVRGFASGGLVDRRPALASGRLPANNQRPFVLNIPGAGSFRGSIAAPDSVLQSLSRASTFEQMAQGGRSPGWRR